MGGVGDFLFGEDKEVKTQKIERLTPGQMALLNELTGLLKGQLGQGVEPYPGQLVAGPSGIQQQLLQLLSPEGGSVGGLTGQGAEYVSKLLGQQFNPEETTEYWQKAFVQPAERSWRENVVPVVMEHYAAQNALDSGAARRALARSGTDLQTQLNAELAKLLWGEKQNLIGRQDTAATMGLNLLPQLMGAGTEQRAITQQQLQEPYQKWQMSQPWANPWLQQLPAALEVSPYQIDTYTTGGGTGLLGSILPTAAQAGMGALAGHFAGTGAGMGALLALV